MKRRGNTFTRISVLFLEPSGHPAFEDSLNLYNPLFRSHSFKMDSVLSDLKALNTQMTSHTPTPSLPQPHRSETGSSWEAGGKAMGTKPPAREQPILWAWSRAGFSLSRLCKAYQNEIEKKRKLSSQCMPESCCCSENAWVGTTSKENTDMRRHWEPWWCSGSYNHLLV